MKRKDRARILAAIPPDKLFLDDKAFYAWAVRQLAVGKRPHVHIFLSETHPMRYICLADGSVDTWNLISKDQARNRVYEALAGEREYVGPDSS